MRSPPLKTRTETGAIRKHWRHRTAVALVYPNTYTVGMSNLGFQTVYRLLNEMDHAVCERVFLPDANEGPIKSEESGQPLTAFDLIAFSVSFESDYLGVVRMIAASGIPVFAADRPESAPLVIAGGVACMLNPEPLAPFLDAVLIGEAEPILPPMMAAFDPHRPRRELLITWAEQVPGSYVPMFYDPEWHEDGTLRRYRITADVPRRVRRVRLSDLSMSDTVSTLLTPETTFENTCLVEVGRGCPHGCRFCSAGFVYRPPRFRSVSQLTESIAQGVTRTDRVGLVGAAVSDLPDLDRLCARFSPEAVRLSFSSLRADALTPALIDTLKRSRVKTATIAPDAGSERLRRVINKGVTEARILTAAESLVHGGIPNLKLYFMLGLPTETDADVQAIVGLCKRIKHHFLESSRGRGRIGSITVSLSSFVPKPVTPFQWAAMDDVKTLKRKIKQVKTGLKRVANVRVHSDIPKHAYVQAALARGDRRAARMLLLAMRYGGNWGQALKASPLNADFFAIRERSLTETLPWEVIDHGVETDFLKKEYERALAGRSSADCPMDADCNRCGVCGGGSEENQKKDDHQQADRNGQ